MAHLVWDRFGDVPNYVEPFAGSLAVLLNRPTPPRTETVNDLDAYLANFWRALQHDPDGTADNADWPVNEADLLARHRWLVSTGAARLENISFEPDYYDVKVAGWWVWGICAWIGTGWCVQRGNGDQPKQMPHLGDAGMWINRKLPHLGDAGRGINRKLPHLGDAGRGVENKRPHLMTKGKGIHRIASRGVIHAYFAELSERLRNVRVCCGDWSRVLGESVTVKHGMTGVFLDPPYDSAEHDVDYSAGGFQNISKPVHAWAIANGDNPLLRIALCGYEGEHSMPESWECVAWKATGGYGSQSDGMGRKNANRERIWFSPACLTEKKLL